MKTILILIFAATLFTGCNQNFNIGQHQGNGNVITEERNVNEDFDQVKGSAGLEIFLTEGEENKITVEADENLMEFIETKIENGRLTITTSENIGSSEAKKIHIVFKNLSEIEASSGAEITGNSVIKNENLSLQSSSGATLKLEVFSKDVSAKTSSGAEMKITGKSSSLTAKASSGSELDARDLMVINCNADASSGASISVNVKERLTTDASSGGEIQYYGSPTEVSKNDSYSGNVQKM